MPRNEERSETQDALDALHREVYEKHMAPYWAIDSSADHDEDNQVMDKRKAVPFSWCYKEDIEPLLYRSAELIKMENSERRSLVLVNPGLAPSRATVTTLYMAYRLNDPIEIMPPHRHSPNAIRLGLIGAQNFTGVEGENIVFGPGDLVLTPHDTWHNHGNEGDQPAINLSVLDLPLAEALNSLHFEHDYSEQEEGSLVFKKMQTQKFPAHYSEQVYSQGGFLPRFVSHSRGVGKASPMYIYRWEVMSELLERYKDWDGDPYEGIVIEYVDPTRGTSIYKTMTFFVQMLRPGEKTLPMKQNSSLLLSPLEGAGYSVVDGKRFDWSPFDTVAVPGGLWCEHVNGSESDRAILFVASDEPTLKALGFYRKFGKTEAGDVLRLV